MALSGDLNRLRQLAGINEDISRPITTDDIEKVFFGDLKNAGEKDTEVENEIYAALDEFIDGLEMTEAKPKLLKILKNLHRLKPKYPDDLIPKAKVVYRGTSASEQIYKSLILAKDDIRADGEYNYSFMYHPRSEIQSWSTSKRVAKIFAELNAFGVTETPAIMTTAVDDHFILTAALTNMIRRKSLGHVVSGDEHEIIRISKEPMKTKLTVSGKWLRRWWGWYNSLHDEKLPDKFSRL